MARRIGFILVCLVASPVILIGALVMLPGFIRMARRFGVRDAWWIVRLGARVGRKLGLRGERRFRRFAESLAHEFDLGFIGIVDMYLIADALPSWPSQAALRREMHSYAVMRWTIRRRLEASCG